MSGSDLYQDHVEFCEECIETKYDDSLTEDEKGQLMHACFMKAIQEMSDGR